MTIFRYCIFSQSPFFCQFSLKNPKSNMSVERLFFGQKYVVFWAKHLISILGIRFGGSRDEILTLHITTIVRCIVYAMFCFFSNIVKNIKVNVFFKTLLKHRIVKQKVRCFMRCFRFQMAWAHNAKNG